MPTYEYTCKKGHTYIEVRSMSANQKVYSCPEEGCGAELIRKFGTPPISFKGSGFSASKG
jgi:putative FmdB family regulatory protein